MDDREAESLEAESTRASKGCYLTRGNQQTQGSFALRRVRTFAWTTVPRDVRLSPIMFGSQALYVDCTRRKRSRRRRRNLFKNSSMAAKEALLPAKGD